MKDFWGNDISRLPAICVAEPSPGVFVQREIISAAVRVTLKDGTKLPVMSARHGSPGLHLILDALKRAGNVEKAFGYGEDQGFTDQFDHYWTREEAFIIAKHKGQLKDREKTGAQVDELYSEDLW